MLGGEGYCSEGGSGAPGSLRLGETRPCLQAPRGPAAYANARRSASGRSHLPDSFARCPEQPRHREEEPAEGLSPGPGVKPAPTQRSLERPLQSRVGRGRGREMPGSHQWGRVTLIYGGH